MTDLQSLVAQWESDGIITAEQGGQILAKYRSPLNMSLPRGSLIAEALGYVGGALAMIAVIFIASIYWPSLNLTARTSLTGGATLVVLAAGAVLPKSMGQARTRLRAVLWALAVAMLGVCAAVLLDGLGWSGDDSVLTASLSAAVLAAVLWALQKTFLQQAALAVSLVVATGTAVSHLPHNYEEVIGVAVWGLGLAWLLLAWGGLLPPQRTAFLLGGAAVIGGSQLTTQYDWGLTLASITVAILVTAAVLARDLWLLGVGATGVLITVPIIVNRFWQGQLAAPLALLAAGILMIAVGVLVARRRSSGNTPAPAVAIPASVAIATATIAVAMVTAVVLSIGKLWG